MHLSKDAIVLVVWNVTACPKVHTSLGGWLTPTPSRLGVVEGKAAVKTKGEYQRHTGK